jgi:hypothetical protein
VLGTAGIDWSVGIGVIAICVSIVTGALILAFSLGSFRQEVRDSFRDIFRRLGLVEQRLDTRTFDGQMQANGHLTGTIDSHEPTP